MTSWRSGSGIVSLLVALLVVGALSMIEPQQDDPEQITRVAVGEWGQTTKNRVRVIEVRKTPQLVNFGEEESVPGASFVVFTVEAEPLERANTELLNAELRVEDRTYSQISLVVPPGAGPGFVVTSHVGFVVPDEVADHGELVVLSKDTLYTGFLRPTLHIDFSDPTPVPEIREPRPKMVPR